MPDITITAEKPIKLLTHGKYCESDIIVTPEGVKLFGAIGVDYPVGSILTCTNGTDTFSAETTSGQWVFAIPEAGTWTVTSTDGTNTKSQSVNISTEGQFKAISISYRYYLFEEGVGIANDWGTAGNATVVQKNNDAIIIKSTSGYGGNNNVKAYYLQDLTRYTLLYAEVETTKAGTNNVGVFDTSVPGTYTSLSASVSTSVANERQIVSLDISTYTGEYYVGIHAFNLEKVTMYNFWLE